MIIYAPLLWREERAPICSKFQIMDIEKFDFDSLTDEQFNKFIWSLDALKARLNRVSVEELEREFEGKSLYLQENEHYELTELEVGEFVETLFERRALGNGEVVVPFEEIQSHEYRLWLSQKMRNRRGVSDGEAPGQLSSPQIDYSGYRMWRYNPVIFYKEDGKARHRLMLLDDDETLTFLENREFALSRKRWHCTYNTVDGCFVCLRLHAVIQTGPDDIGRQRLFPNSLDGDTGRYLSDKTFHSDSSERLHKESFHHLWTVGLVNPVSRAHRDLFLQPVCCSCHSRTIDSTDFRPFPFLHSPSG